MKKNIKSKILNIFRYLLLNKKKEVEKTPCETKSKLFTEEQIKMGWKVKSNK